MSLKSSPKFITSQFLLQNTFSLRKPRANIFTGVIKRGNMFIERTFKDSKELETMYQSAVYIFISSYNKRFGFLVKRNVDISRTQGEFEMIYIFFGSSFGRVQLYQVSLL